MGENSLRNEFFKYVSFNIIGMIGLSCYFLADTYFIAQGVGPSGLAALNIAIPAYSCMNGIGLMIGIGAATRFSLTKSKSVFTQAMMFAGGMGLLFLLIGLFFSEPLAMVLGADGETFENTSIYLKTLLSLSPMFLLNNLLLAFVRNDGDPRLSMIAMVTGSLSNIVMDYVFLFPLNMGMFGAALATGISPIISLGVLSTYFMKKRNTFHFQRELLQVSHVKDISALGNSALITELSSGVVILTFNMLILDLASNIGVAAYGVIANIALVIVAIFTGIGQGIQPVVSRCYSQGRDADGRTVLRYGMVTAVSIAVVIYILAALFADEIVGAFNRDGDLAMAEIATNGLYIYFTAFVFVGINIVSSTYFAAMDRPQKAMLLSLLRGVALIVPIALLLAWLFQLNGVWLATPVTELLVALVALWLVKKNK